MIRDLKHSVVAPVSSVGSGVSYSIVDDIVTFVLAVTTVQSYV